MIEHTILKDLTNKITGQLQENQTAIQNLRSEQNTQMMKLLNYLSCYQTTVLNTLLAAHSDINKNIFMKKIGLFYSEGVLLINRINSIVRSFTDTALV